MPDIQLIRCPACGSLNRVPVAKLKSGLAPVCGKCKARLPVDSKPVTVTDATFASVVERSSLPVLLDLWAPWCGPCRMLGPIVDQLAREFAGQVKVTKLDIDKNPETAERYNVRSIPTLLFFREGKLVESVVGLRAKAELAARLTKLAA
jgi:thioredoxin 2